MGAWLWGLVVVFFELLVPASSWRFALEKFLSLRTVTDPTFGELSASYGFASRRRPQKLPLMTDDRILIMWLGFFGESRCSCELNPHYFPHSGDISVHFFHLLENHLVLFPQLLIQLGLVLNFDQQLPHHLLVLGA